MIEMYREYFKTNPTVRIAVIGTKGLICVGLDLSGCLAPLLTLFQLYRDCQLEKTTVPGGTNPDKLYNINGCIKYTSIDKGGNRIHNFSGDRD